MPHRLQTLMNAGMEPTSAAITRFVRTHEEVIVVCVQEDIGPRELEDLVWVSCPITLISHIFCFCFWLGFLLLHIQQCYPIWRLCYVDKFALKFKITHLKLIVKTKGLQTEMVINPYFENKVCKVFKALMDGCGKLPLHKRLHLYKNQVRFVSDWKVKCAWLYPGLHWFTP